MRDLSSPYWVIPRFLGKRVIKGNLALANDFGSPQSQAYLEFNAGDTTGVLWEDNKIVQW
jgi:hypothetical protein